jgi:hypothetical protein
MNSDTNKREQLIGELVADLKPVPRAGRTWAKSVMWLCGASIATIGLMLFRGPFRPGFIEQLFAHPQFATESAIGVSAIMICAFAAYHSAIPSTDSRLRQAALALGLITVWMGFYLYGLTDPAIAPSMTGKRDYCYVEVFLVGLPALVFGIIALRNLYPLRGAFSGALIGLAAGTIPALMMQFACMYLVPHILIYHIAPGFSLALLGSVCGFFFLRPK